MTAVAFASVLDAGFVTWDDDANFLNNAAYRGLGVDQLRWMWTTTHLGHWMPLSWMSLGADYLLWEMEPRGYHLTNLLLHAATAGILVPVVAHLLTAARGERAPIGRTDLAIASAAGALLFALHPLRVESVAWITERRDVLSGLFALLATWAYLKGTDEGPHARRQRLIALACFAAGLLSKATVLTLPALLFVLEVYPLRRLGGAAGWATPAARRIYRNLLPFALLSATSAIVSMAALGPVDQLPVIGKVAVSAYSLVFYLAKSLVPVGLSPLYHLPLRLDPLEARFVAAYAIVAATALVAILVRRRAPGVTAGLLIFTLAVFPMLGVHQNGPQIAADRYTYHAAPALAALGAGGLLWLLTRARALALLLAAVVLTTLGALSWRQIAIWHDSASLWRRAVETSTGGWIAHNNLGNALVTAGRLTDAEEQYRRAIQLNPDYAEAYSDLGVALSQLDRLAAADSALRRAITLRPAFDDAMVNLGVVLGRRGAHTEALSWFESAVRIDPRDLAAEVNWGNALVRLERPAEAIAHYERALQLDPRNEQARANLDVAQRLVAPPR